VGDATGPTDCRRCAELEREVESLRREVALLREKNAELLRDAAERDFERPPHYQ
jgi:uncharacterized coiled-coil protein SlyX